MRVLVLRPGAQAEATLRGLAERGHVGVSVPLLVIEALSAEPPDLEPAALVLTSANAVPAVAARMARFGGLPVFAVGARTAQALTVAGFSSVLSADGDALALAGLIAEVLPARSMLLHVAGRDHRPEPAGTLRKAGFTVAGWDVYAANPIRSLPDGLVSDLAARRFDAALHYSRRSGETFAALAREAGLARRLRSLVQVCLSAEVAEGLAGLEVDRVIAATAPTEAALFDALDRACLTGMAARARPSRRRDARHGTIPFARSFRTTKD